MVASLLVAAGVALAAWLVLLFVLAVATRPRGPDCGPVVMDPGGDEPPAVVNLLVNRWEPTRTAVPATLLDLAARRFVDVDQVSPERFVIRARRKATAPGELTPYERQVLDRVQRLAVDGVVPCEALTTGPEEVSDAWWKRFDKAVVADAKERGLARDRWSRPVLLLLGATAVVPAALAAGAAGAWDARTPNTGSSSKNGAGGWIGLAFMAWFALMALVFSLRALRDTPAGTAAASKWLGLKEFLQRDGQFAGMPVSAVAIWDRYLAFAAAMGVAAAAVHALPLGSESDRSAWSAYGGRWREVRIKYPSRNWLGWGRHPVAAFLGSLLWLAAAGALAIVVLPIVADGLRNLKDDVADSDGAARAVAIGGTAVFAVMGIAVALGVARGLLLLVRSTPDLFARVDVEGQVVRKSASGDFVAVDDGHHDEVKAWALPAKHPPVSEGDMVRATISPRLGHVFRLEVSRT